MHEITTGSPPCQAEREFTVSERGFNDRRDNVAAKLNGLGKLYIGFYFLEGFNNLNFSSEGLIINF